MGDENKKVSALNVSELLHDIWKYKFLIAAVMILSAVIMVVRVKYFMPDSYTASGVLYIRSEMKSENMGMGSDVNDIYNARALSTTYMETLNLRSFLTEIKEATGNVYSENQIKNMMTITPINETEYISVSVTAGTAEMAYKIADCICKKANSKFAETFRNGEVVIVDEVSYPKNANSKGGLKKTAIAFVAGAVIGVLIIIAKRLVDKKLHRSDEIANKYNISILGETVAHVSSARKKRKKKNVSDDFIDNTNIINENTDFDTIETYKSIRTNVMFSMPKKEHGKVIAVTSASPGEGKTTTTVNLAVTFAQIGAKVIIVDCDLRKARVHRYLQIKRDAGVSNVLCGYKELDKAIRKNVRENLDVITAGDMPPNPAELLETTEFEKLIEKLSETYDYIFLDTPPLTIVTDAVIMMKHCTGVILIARQEITNLDLFEMALNEIKKTDVKILGAVVHDCNEKQKKYAYGRKGKHGYSYSYHYGDNKQEQ